MTWPSARRTMCGGSLKPEPSYSPISSTPSAQLRRRRTAGAATGSVVTVVVAAVVLAQHAPRLARSRGTSSSVKHVEHARLLRLERRGELAGGQVLALERAQVAAHVEPASARPWR